MLLLTHLQLNQVIYVTESSSRLQRLAMKHSMSTGEPKDQETAFQTERIVMGVNSIVIHKNIVLGMFGEAE